MGKILIVFLVILLFTGCSYSATTSEEDLQKQKQEQAQREQEQAQKEYHSELEKFAKDHNINKYILHDDSRLVGFSIDIQNTLLGKVYILSSALIDIFKKNDKTYVVFEDYLCDKFILECSDEIVKKIKNANEKDTLAYTFNYIIAANITEVNKLNYEVNAFGDDENGYDITIDNLSVTIYRGSCVNVEKD